MDELGVAVIGAQRSHWFVPPRAPSPALIFRVTRGNACRRRRRGALQLRWAIWEKEPLPVGDQGINDS